MEMDWSDTAPSQGMLAASRSWKGKGIDSPLEVPEEASPANTFISAH